MSGSRTKTGCWTCRLRRKKCDENIPACSNCVSRNLSCYGYGQKPAWMLGKESWQQVLDSEEARAIRNGAERSYSHRRQEKMPAVPWSAGVLVQDLKDFAWPTHKTSVNPSTRPERLWSNNTQTVRDCNYTPNLQYVQTFLNLIFPLQWGFFDLHRQPGRKWLFDMIIASEPMYHASFGLCVSFESGLKAGSTSGQCDVTPEVRASRLHAMRGLQSYIADMRGGNLDQSLLPKAIQAVAVVLLLSSLEIFGETEGAWEVHLNAAGTVLDLINKQPLTINSATSSCKGSIGHLLASSMPSFETRALEFFVTTYVWTDILAEATHGMTYSKPRHFDYLPLLREHIIDTRSMMGCHSSVMVVIKEISMFATSIRKGQQPEAADVASTLTIQIQDLIQEAASSSSPSAEGLETDSSWVTLLHAYAALVYLQTVITHEALSIQSNIQETVTECLGLLEALPCRLFIRVCWPFTVAGCMAGEGHHPRFRALVDRVAEAGHVLGFTWKGLIVMEKCWELRRCKPESMWCWRTTMEHMHARILLV
ncbi:hypothetical protein BR93DRAFT_922708 [Coniochaeta sp. PMI_546]|nr:hypothetical protein BR93DRAFT_922708 [Coniochaeta sp. PMI_546]